MPKLRIVSIIPGIDTAALEQTETSSWFWGTPKFLPWWISISVITYITWVMIPSGSFSPKRFYSIQVLVVKMNPNGTGRSWAVISWRFAPLLLNKALSFALPSVNSQTDFCMIYHWVFMDFLPYDSITLRNTIKKLRDKL